MERKLAFGDICIDIVATVRNGARPIDGVCVASPVKVYLDLTGVKGRGEEAARALLEEVIKRTW